MFWAGRMSDGIDLAPVPASGLVIGGLFIVGIGSVGIGDLGRALGAICASESLIGFGRRGWRGKVAP